MKIAIIKTMKSNASNKSNRAIACNVTMHKGLSQQLVDGEVEIQELRVSNVLLDTLCLFVLLE
jgi:hypothetical protein